MISGTGAEWLDRRKKGLNTTRRHLGRKMGAGILEKMYQLRIVNSQPVPFFKFSGLPKFCVGLPPGQQQIPRHLVELQSQVKKHNSKRPHPGTGLHHLTNGTPPVALSTSQKSGKHHQF